MQPPQPRSFLVHRLERKHEEHHEFNRPHDLPPKRHRRVRKCEDQKAAQRKDAIFAEKANLQPVMQNKNQRGPEKKEISNEEELKRVLDDSYNVKSFPLDDRVELIKKVLVEEF